VNNWGFAPRLVGLKKVAMIIPPKKALKRDNRYQRDKKRKLCKRRAAIEPIIGHLKSKTVSALL
jgi:hypothetical protein